MVETELIQGHTPIDYTKESIKLMRNSKGYTWEIKVIGSGKDGLFEDADLLHLKELNSKIDEEYGKNDI